MKNIIRVSNHWKLERPGELANSSCIAISGEELD